MKTNKLKMIMTIFFTIFILCILSLTVNATNDEIEILEKKDEFSLCRVLDKNDILWIKNEFIYEKKKHYYCLDDYIDAFLSVKKGELIKVVGIYHNWAYIKYKNEIGWIPIKILDE